MDVKKWAIQGEAKQRLEFLWQGRCQGDQKLVALKTTKGTTKETSSGVIHLQVVGCRLLGLHTSIDFREKSPI